MAPTKTLLGLLLVIEALVPISYADSSPRAVDWKAEIEKLWNETLYPYEGFFIPALPTIPIHLSTNDVHAALSLANLELTGISNMKVKDVNIIRMKVQMVLPKITLKVGHYSSGGHILNMPFSGEGPLLVALHDFNVNVTISLKKNSDGHICLTKSIDPPALSLKAIELDLRRLEVEFGNLNPGTDQGQLINIVIGAFGPEIVDYLELLINGDNKFMALPNDIFVDLINTIHCPGWVRNNPIQDQDKMTNYLYELFYQLVQDLKIPGTRN